MSNEKKRLPDKVWELVALACDDMDRVISDDRYVLDLNSVWHEKILGRCYVCAAGAVMAKSLRVEIYEEFDPQDFEEDVAERFFALNGLRCVDVEAIMYGIERSRSWRGEDALDGVDLDGLRYDVKNHVDWLWDRRGRGEERGEEIVERMRLLQGILKKYDV